jgi:hypothetical protein
MHCQYAPQAQEIRVTTSGKSIQQIEEFPCYTLTSTPASIRCSFTARIGTCDKPEVGTSILFVMSRANIIYPIRYE